VSPLINSCGTTSTGPAPAARRDARRGARMHIHARPAIFRKPSVADLHLGDRRLIRVDGDEITVLPLETHHHGTLVLVVLTELDAIADRRLARRNVDRLDRAADRLGREPFGLVDRVENRQRAGIVIQRMARTRLLAVLLLVGG